MDAPESNLCGSQQSVLENTGAAPISFHSIVGSVLFIGSLGLTLWLVRMVHQLLYMPDQIPLLQRILDPSTGGGLSITGKMSDGELAIAAPAMVKYAFFVLLCLILLSTLGRIVSAMLSGAISLFNNRPPR